MDEDTHSFQDLASHPPPRTSRPSIHLQQETVYGSDAADGVEEDSGHIMSERVQSIASGIYREFERMIPKYGEDVVKEMMPHVVGILESLDGAFKGNEEKEAELELCKDDNEQLLSQYDREKQLRKSAEQRLMLMEDVAEDERKEINAKLESLQAMVRTLELKGKNSVDHISRLEEKEAETKKEFSKLHERYNELLKKHMEHMERSKLMSSSGDRMIESISSKKSMFQMPMLRPVVFSPTDGGHGVGAGYVPPHSTVTKLVLNQDGVDGDGVLASGSSAEDVNLGDDTMVKEKGKGDSMNTRRKPSGGNGVGGRKSTSSVGDELGDPDSCLLGDTDDLNDVTGQIVNPGDFSSSGMSKEVENLILENTELLSMKNALNIVKDDLIAQVDELLSEQELVREELETVKTSRDKLKTRIGELEDEMKRIRETDDRHHRYLSDDDDDVPMAQRKRFTRVEMARVLMERNQYKERLMELQEAVRWTEMIRASREHPDLVGGTAAGITGGKRRSSVWNFFSNLFSSSSAPSKRSDGRKSSSLSSTQSMTTIRYTAPTSAQSSPRHSASGAQRNRNESGGGGDGASLMVDPALVRNQLDNGRLQSYGWTVSLTTMSGAHGSELSVPRSGARNHRMPVPVPVYCRPVSNMVTPPGCQNDSTSKLWCAMGVDRLSNEMDSTNSEGSEVWICSTVEDCTCVTVVNANHPATPLDEFTVSAAHVLCIASVPALADNVVIQPAATIIRCSGTSSDYQLPPLTSSSPSRGGAGGGLGGQEGEGDEVEWQRMVGTISRVTCARYVDDIVTRKPDLNIKSSPCHSSLVTSESTVQEVQRVEEEKWEAEAQNVEDLEIRQSLMWLGAQNGWFLAANSTTPPDPRPSSSYMEESSIIPIFLFPLGLDPSLYDMPFSNLSLCRTCPIQFLFPEVIVGTSYLSPPTSVYIHPSSTLKRKERVYAVKLADSVFAMVASKDRVFVSLANGTVSVFCRTQDGGWDMSSYYVLTLGRADHAVRCLCLISSSTTTPDQEFIWCAHRNTVHAVNTSTLLVQKSFDAHPRRESQVRQMIRCGDGVWISIRLDSTLRLYHAATQQHLQDVDVEPYISKMLGTGKLGFSFVRVTSLLAAAGRLWIGTGNGVIVCVPLCSSSSSSPSSSSTTQEGKSKEEKNTCRPDVVFQGTSSSSSDSSSFPTHCRGESSAQIGRGGAGGGREGMGGYIPYCSMAQAQLSFHGHRDAVKFLVAVPDAEAAAAGTVGSAVSRGVGGVEGEQLLVMCGGEGYIDFRLGANTRLNDEEAEFEEKENRSRDTEAGRGSRGGGGGRGGDPSYLIVWQVCG